MRSRESLSHREQAVLASIVRHVMGHVLCPMPPEHASQHVQHTSIAAIKLGRCCAGGSGECSCSQAASGGTAGSCTEGAQVACGEEGAVGEICKSDFSPGACLGSCLLNTYPVPIQNILCPKFVTQRIKNCTRGNLLNPYLFVKLKPQL